MQKETVNAPGGHEVTLAYFTKPPHARGTSLWWLQLKKMGMKPNHVAEAYAKGLPKLAKQFAEQLLADADIAPGLVVVPASASRQFKPYLDALLGAKADLPVLNGAFTKPDGFQARLSSLCSFRTLYFTPESGPATEGFSCRGAVMNDEGNAARKIRKLRASRDLWKQRSAEKQQEIRQLRVTVRDLSSSRENWKTRVKELEQQLQAAHEAHAAVGPGSWIFFGGLMDNQAMPRTRRTPITLSSD